VLASAALGTRAPALLAGTGGAVCVAAPRHASLLDMRFVHRRSGGAGAGAAATECDGVRVSAPDAHGVRHVSFSGAGVGAAGSGNEGDGGGCSAPCGRDVAVDLTVPARGSLAFDLQVRADAVYSRLRSGQAAMPLMGAVAFAAVGCGAAGQPAAAPSQLAGPDPIAAVLLGGTLRPASVAARQRSQRHEAALVARTLVARTRVGPTPTQQLHSSSPVHTIKAPPPLLRAQPCITMRRLRARQRSSVASLRRRPLQQTGRCSAGCCRRILHSKAAAAGNITPSLSPAATPQLTRMRCCLCWWPLHPTPSCRPTSEVA